MSDSAKVRAVISLGLAQTLAWASSYYLPAILATPTARDLGVSTPAVFGAFSVAMVVSAAVGPPSGRLIDRYGGRPVLVGTSVLFAAALLALGSADSTLGLFAAWCLMGMAMGSGLYEAAFAAVVRLYHHDARNAITGITLMAGFASTVGWPLSAWLEMRLGWRGACYAWAMLHLLVGLPLNASLPRLQAVAPNRTTVDSFKTSTASFSSQQPALLTNGLLAFVFAATWFISTAMAAHLPRIVQEAGASLAVAVAVGALVGPAQVAGRLLEFGLLRRVHPLLSARLAALAHPIGAAVLLLLGPATVSLFAVLHGAGNGILTIAKGTLPLALFGPSGYGARQGWLMLPARVAQAVAPFLFGVLLIHLEAGALWVTAGLGLASFIALMWLRGHAPHCKPHIEKASMH